MLLAWIEQLEISKDRMRKETVEKDAETAILNKMIQKRTYKKGG